MKRKYVAIEGNIGAGKTTLAKLLADHWGGRLLLEEFADNPFLERFYAQPERHAFSVELFFLADRYHQMRDELTRPSLFEQVTVSDYFLAKSLIFGRENLQEDEYSLFNRLFKIMFTTLPKPDLLVYLYLDVPLLLKNIEKRGRPYEQGIDPHYLERVQQGYLRFLRQQSDLTALIVDINGLDFVGNTEEFYTLLNIIEKDYSKGLHTIAPMS